MQPATISPAAQMTTGIDSGSLIIKILGWTLLIVTIVGVGYGIVVDHRTLKKYAKEEDEQQKKIDELEMNLKTQLGDRYVILG